MSPLAKKQFNTVVGGVFMALGVIGWMAAGVFVFKPNEFTQMPPVVLAPTVDENSCRQIAQAMFGFQARQVQSKAGSASEIVLGSADLSNPEAVLKDITSAAALCKRELRSMCIGVGCEGGGWTATLGLSSLQLSANELSKKPGSAPAPKAAEKPAPKKSK